MLFLGLTEEGYSLSRPIPPGYENKCSASDNSLACHIPQAARVGVASQCYCTGTRLSWHTMVLFTPSQVKGCCN